MKKVLVFIVAVAILANCTSRKDRLAKQQIGHQNYIEIQGHDYWMPTVGSVTGQSNGTICQLVHLPECQKCWIRYDSIMRSAIRKELHNFGKEVGRCEHIQ